MARGKVEDCNVGHHQPVLGQEWVHAAQHRWVCTALALLLSAFSVLLTLCAPLLLSVLTVLAKKPLYPLLFGGSSGSGSSGSHQKTPSTNRGLFLLFSPSFCSHFGVFCSLCTDKGTTDPSKLYTEIWS